MGWVTGVLYGRTRVRKGNRQQNCIGAKQHSSYAKPIARLAARNDPGGSGWVGGHSKQKRASGGGRRALPARPLPPRRAPLLLQRRAVLAVFLLPALRLAARAAVLDAAATPAGQQLGRLGVLRRAATVSANRGRLLLNLLLLLLLLLLFLLLLLPPLPLLFLLLLLLLLLLPPLLPLLPLLRLLRLLLLLLLLLGLLWSCRGRDGALL
jgi:hypothetical protein